jgi:O-antigen biosynthesis protein
MPTWNRRCFIPAAIDSWLRQDYEPKELIILDDGEEPIEDLIPSDSRIRYVFEDLRRCTGDKRNRVNSLARGEVICHFDDDDWSAPSRISYQVNLMTKTGKDVTGFSNLLFWDSGSRQPKIYRAAIPGYVCGTTLCYTRELWERHRFRAKQQASDNDFVYPIAKSIAASKEISQMVARIHDCHHTSPKSSIREPVSGGLIPPGFWDNEKLVAPFYPSPGQEE